MTDQNSQQQFEQSMTPLTVATQKAKQNHKYASWLVSLLLLVFPPVALYLMWRDKTYHSWFAWISWVFGGFLLLYFLFINYVLVPRINGMIAVASAQKVVFSLWDWVLVLGLGIGQFGLGFLLKKQIKKTGSLTAILLIVAILLLVADYVVPSMVYSKILGPIYSSVLGS